MKIGIDVRAITNQKTGLGVYTKNLVKQLSRISPKNLYLLFGKGSKGDLSTPMRFFWDQVAVPFKATVSSLDLFHKPCFSSPIIYFGKTVLTVHDLIPLLFPQNFSLSARLYWVRLLPFSIKTAEKIITDSESTKGDLIKILKIPEERIRLVYPGPSFKAYCPSPEALKKTREKFNLPARFILTIGTLEPRKNLPFLIEAFAEAKKRYKFEEKLVIVGKIGWGVEDLSKKIQAFGEAKEVILLGYIDDESLPMLYSLASVFAFPSLYEGFGLPVLDALSMGCPVIVSDTSSLPEIVKDAGILANPRKVRDWSRALGELITGENLKRKFKIIGPQRAKEFSWEKCAKETLSVYEEVLRGEK